MEKKNEIQFHDVNVNFFADPPAKGKPRRVQWINYVHYIFFFFHELYFLTMECLFVFVFRVDFVADLECIPRIKKKKK